MELKITVTESDTPQAINLAIQTLEAFAVSHVRNKPAAPEVPVAAVPLPPATSTVVADPQPIAPVAPPVSSMTPPAPPAPALPTVPEATVPTAPVAPMSPAGVELDKDGFPWDARIHSGSKEKNKDGTWRARRNLNDPDLVARVQAELRAVMAVQVGQMPLPEVEQNPFAATPAVMPPAVPEVPVVVSPPIVPSIPESAPLPPVPTPPAAALGVPIPPAPTTAATLTDPTTLPELMPRVTGAMAAGTVPPTAMLDACKAVGLPDLPSLAHRPDLIPQVWATLRAAHPGVWA